MTSPTFTDHAIRWSTALAVLSVAAVAAVVSYRHAYDLVVSHGETGWTARLIPITVDGLIYASSMVLLHAARHKLTPPALARWLLALGIVATVAANVTHGLGDGPVGAIVAAWPAVALVGSYELLMTLLRSQAVVPVPDTGASLADPLEIRAADAFATEVARGSVPTIRRIRTELRVGQPRAQRIRAYLASRTDPGSTNGGTARRRPAPGAATNLR